MSARRVVIVGAGHAGFHTACFLRSGGWTGGITLIDSAPGMPYQRPPLSKDFLWGKQELEDGIFRPSSYFFDNQIDLIVGRRVLSIDRGLKSLVLEGKFVVEYEHLVIATGSSPRALSVPGANLDGVVSLSTSADAVVLREYVEQARAVVVVGGGFIGLEVASMVVSSGKRAVVLEAADRIMGRALTRRMSEYFERVHRNSGVDLQLATGVSAIEGVAGVVCSVVTTSEERHEADLVVVGIGSSANDCVAADSGLATDRGVLVDTHLRCSDPTVFAIGDCARFPFDRGRGVEMIRLESVQNATDQARYVAQQICGESTEPYVAVPWFWTEQFGRKLQIAGLVDGFDRIEEDARDPDSFSLSCYSGDTLLGVESVNAPRDHIRARRQLHDLLAVGNLH